MFHIRLIKVKASKWVLSRWQYYTGFLKGNVVLGLPMEGEYVWEGLSTFAVKHEMWPEPPELV